MNIDHASDFCDLSVFESAGFGPLKKKDLAISFFVLRFEPSIIQWPHSGRRCDRDDEISRSVPNRLDRIISMKHALLQLAAEIDWSWIDAAIKLFSPTEAALVRYEFMRVACRPGD
jgi:hypothetical protein